MIPVRRPAAAIDPKNVSRGGPVEASLKAGRHLHGWSPTGRLVAGFPALASRSQQEGAPIHADYHVLGWRHLATAGAADRANPALLEELRRDPAAVVLREIGYQIPFAVTVDQDGHGNWIIGPTAMLRGEELSDELLDLVSGGATIRSCCVPACTDNCPPPLPK